MSQIEQYRKLYDHEKNCDEKILAMISSVSEAGRSDARFQQAILIAGHLAACREFWLAHMTGKDIRSADGHREVSQGVSDAAALKPRFAAIQTQWSGYLAGLDEARLAQDFEFSDNGERFRLPIEVQIVQLFGHASYHRGQIALLVNQLSGEAVDTDYVDLWWATHKETEEKEAR